MHRTIFIWLCAAVTAGCGSSTSSTHDVGVSTCSPVAPKPQPSAVPNGASLEQIATANGLAALDRLVGRFLRGEIVVYRGTMQAHDDASGLGNPEVYGPKPDGLIAEGPALALLDTQSDPAALVLHGVGQHTHVILTQQESDPSTTNVGLILGDDSVGETYGSCSSCAPSFWDHPESIDLASLESSGVTSVFKGTAPTGGYVDVTFHTTASASLSVASPCSLTWDELAVLDTVVRPNTFSDNLGLQSFVSSGDDMVWKMQSSIQAPGTPCPTYTPYSIDLYVGAVNLANFGARNFTSGTPNQSCPP